MKLIEDLGLQEYGSKGQKARYGIYECTKCGIHKRINSYSVKHKGTTMCRSCAHTRHGASKRGRIERIYRIWSSMIGRCRDKGHTSYHKYGAKGIKVCDNWKKFENFRDWATSNGYTEKLTIDRKDGTLGYSPENCRWATYSEQNKNRRPRNVA